MDNGDDDGDGDVYSFYNDMNVMMMMMFFVVMEIMLIFDGYADDADGWN